jgi:hypothetical protein
LEGGGGHHIHPEARSRGSERAISINGEDLQAKGKRKNAKSVSRVDDTMKKPSAELRIAQDEGKIERAAVVVVVGVNNM